MKNLFADFEFSTSSKYAGGSSGDTDPTDSTSKTPIGAIVGGTIGGVAALLAIVLAVFLVRRRKKNAGTMEDPGKNVHELPGFRQSSPTQELDASTHREKVVSYELSSSGYNDTFVGQELDASVAGYRDTRVSPELQGSEVGAWAAGVHSAQGHLGHVRSVSELHSEATGGGSARGRGGDMTVSPEL